MKTRLPLLFIVVGVYNCDTVSAGNLNAQLQVKYGCGTATISVSHDVRRDFEYEYQWSNGAPPSSSITLQNGELDRICVEIYCSCNKKAKAKAYVCVDLNWPTIEVFDLVTSPTSCDNNDGTAALTNPETIKSVHWNVQGSPSGIKIGGLGSGSYSVDVMDKHGCDHHLEFEINGPGQMDVSGINVRSHPVDCNGNGGTVIFEFDADLIISLNGKEARTFTGLTGGDHAFNIRRISTGECGVLVVNIANPLPPHFEIEVGAPSCIPGGDGWARIITDGTVQWSDPSNSTSAEISDRFAGTYSAWVISKNEKTCGGATVIIPEPTGPLIAVTTIAPSCSYSRDGKAFIAPKSKAPPMTVTSMGMTWHGIGNGDDVSIDQLPPGSYSAVVVDAAGCPSSKPFTIIAPPPLVIQSVTGNCQCAGDSTGSIVATGSGGTPDYRWIWINEQDTISTNANLTKAVAGIYTVHLSDQHNCEASGTDTITQPSPLKSNNNQHLFGRYFFFTSISIMGGVAPYQVSIVKRLGRGEFSEKPTNRRSFFGTRQLEMVLRDASNCEDWIQLHTKFYTPLIFIRKKKPSKHGVRSCCSH